MQCSLDKQSSFFKSSGEIKIPDVQPDAFLELLRFMYKEDADINQRNVMEMIYVSVCH